MMRRAAKFWSLSGGEKKLLCEASILLLVSGICVRVVAFKHIHRFLRTHWNDRVQGHDSEQESRLVRRSISRAANVFPWKSLCLSRSIAEFIMLRRRGIPAVMLAGARFSGHSSLDAHAWVDTGLGQHDGSSENPRFATVIRIGTEAVDRISCSGTKPQQQSLTRRSAQSN
jgi:hypothetical protein